MSFFHQYIFHRFVKYESSKIFLYIFICDLGFTNQAQLLKTNAKTFVNIHEEYPFMDVDRNEPISNVFLLVNEQLHVTRIFI